MHPEPTQPEIEVALDRSRIPNPQELTRLLEWFFEGTVEPATVARLDAELRALLADPDRRSLTSDIFVGNSRKYFGQAWKELVSHHQFPPSPTELAIWLAVTGTGYPPPRPYCPAALVGSWKETEPATASWRLDANGSLQTDEPTYAKRNRWRVHRKKPDKATFEHDELQLTGELAFVPTMLVLRTVTDRELRAFRPGPDGAIEYRMERS